MSSGSRSRDTFEWKIKPGKKSTQGVGRFTEALCRLDVLCGYDVCVNLSGRSGARNMAARGLSDGLIQFESGWETSLSAAETGSRSIQAGSFQGFYPPAKHSPSTCLNAAIACPWPQPKKCVQRSEKQTWLTTSYGETVFMDLCFGLNRRWQYRFRQGTFERRDESDLRCPPLSKYSRAMYRALVAGGQQGLAGPYERLWPVGKQYLPANRHGPTRS